MANQQHIEWLLEGVEAWNARREREEFVPDFYSAELSGEVLWRAKVNLRGANLTGADVAWANLSGADLVGADLRGATLRWTKLHYAQLEKADVRTLGDYTDLSQVKGLNQKQLNCMLGDSNTRIPDDLVKPKGWPKFKPNEGEFTLAKLPAENMRFNKSKGLHDSKISLGAILRGERATLGKSLLDVQEHLRIKVKYLAAIEEGDASAFEIPGFVAGYVRSYARYLGLDADLAFEAFCVESGFEAMGASLAGIEQPEENIGSVSSVATRHPPFHKDSLAKLASVTPIADVEWTETGHFKAELKPIQPKPRQPLPSPNPAAVTEQLRGVLALSIQLRQQIENSKSPNAAPFIGDAGKIFLALEAQLERDQSDLIPVVVKANIAALKALGPNAEALATTEESLYTVFIEEAQKLLAIFPVLKIIENPYNEEIIPDNAVTSALKALQALDEKANSPEVIEQLGPRLGGVTRDAEGFPWESDKQKIANKSSFWLQVGDKLKNPPDSIKGAAPYATVANAMLTLIKTLLSIIFS